MEGRQIIVAAAGLVALATGAAAADLPTAADGALTNPAAFYAFYVHLGPAALIPDASARISNPLGRIPGATLRVPAQVTAQAELGYRFTPNWAASVTFGVPTTAALVGAGTVAPFGTFGSTTSGPIAVTGHYHFTGFGAFQPYVGGGPVYSIAFNSHDGSISNLQVQSAFGVTAQVGADYMLSDHLGLYIDFKKAYLRTTAHGAAGVVPINADITLDPYVVSGGMTYRF